jgi:microcystin-dependent protein
MPSHSHAVRANSDFADVQSPKSGPLSRPLPERLRLPDNDQSEPGLSRPQALASAGGSQPHNNLMPYLTFTFYTALQGVFPSRG